MYKLNCSMSFFPEPSQVKSTELIFFLVIYSAVIQIDLPGNRHQQARGRRGQRNQDANHLQGLWSMYIYLCAEQLFCNKLIRLYACLCYVFPFIEIKVAEYSYWNFLRRAPLLYSLCSRLQPSRFPRIHSTYMVNREKMTLIMSAIHTNYNDP